MCTCAWLGPMRPPTLEAGREHVDVAEGPIGDAAAHSETCVNGGLYLSPESAVARRIVEVLNDRNRRKPFGLTIFVPVFAGRNGSARRLCSADHAGSGETNDWRQFPIDAHHRLDGEAYGAALGRHVLKAVADRRRVPDSER